MKIKPPVFERYIFITLPVSIILLFVCLPATAQNTSPEPAVFEAEDLTLSNGNVATTNCVCGNPSAGQCVRHQGSVGNAATSSMTYTGPDGLYEVAITYCDESDDNGAPDSYRFFVNGTEQVNWFSSDGQGAGQVWQTELATVTLVSGDFISIDSVRGSSSSYTRIDRFELTGVSTTCGNGAIDEGEACELDQTQSCVDGAGYAGSQECNSQCTDFESCVSNEYCGDDIIQTDAGEACDDGALNGTVGFCNAQCNGIMVAAPTLYEAEDLTLTDGNVASTNCACGSPSAGQCARNQGSVGSLATASTTFSGPDGVYQVDVTYCDERDDNGAPDSYEFSVNGVEQANWFSSDGPGDGQQWQTESAGTVNLVAGDIVSITSARGGSPSWARVDSMMLTPIANPTCGNSVVEFGELCELGQTQSCTDSSGYAGSQECNALCTDFDTCVSTEYCGDDIVQAAAGEACDDGALNGTVGFCNTQCTDLVASECGNGVVEADEVCELGQSQSCSDSSGYAGSQECNALCTDFDACISTEYCGDDIIQSAAGEICDDGALNGTVGFCNSQCTALVSTTCGNGVVEAGELCEIGQTQACFDGAGYGGSQECNALCTDFDACVSNEYCGDDIVQATAGEACDDGALNGTAGFCNLQCNGLIDPPAVLTSVVITSAGQIPMTVDPRQGFDVFGSVSTVEAFDQYGNPIEANFSCTVSENQPSSSLPAFPGAEGFGANAIGGRGGTVIKVTNLNDSGPGSFRSAVTASGPRIVVFEVSGIINLMSSLTITNPYLTIAGETSPGGILVTGYQTTLQTSHVIMRHMRFRVGSHQIANGADAKKLDSFDIWGIDNPSLDEHDIIVDHCSFGWGVDENISTAYNLRNVTISNSLIAEGLSQGGHPNGEHSRGMLIWGEYSPELHISLHHNYFVHNKDRNPLINNGIGDLIVDLTNNVAYNFVGGYAMGSTTDGAKLNWKHNYSKAGVESNLDFYEIYQESSATPAPMVFTEGNIGGSRTTQTGSEWTVANSWRFELADEAWRRLTPWTVPSVTATTMSYEYALQVVANAGATRPFRDSADARVAKDFADGTGALIDNVSFPDDFPIYQDLPAPADIDNDGMSDSWETANGFDISIDDSAGDADHDGYTNIEEYLHYLAGDVGG